MTEVPEPPDEAREERAPERHLSRRPAGQQIVRCEDARDMGP